MDEWADEGIVYPVLVQLAACLTLELETRKLPTLCSLSLVPGALTSIEHCTECGGGKCGQGTVRLVNSYASTNFPAVDPMARCGSQVAFVAQVGIVRCFPTMDSMGRPASEAAMLNATRLQLADMAAIKRAIACCVQEQELQYTLGIYEPFGPEGNCVGGFWSVTIGQ